MVHEGRIIVNIFDLFLLNILLSNIYIVFDIQTQIESQENLQFIIVNNYSFMIMFKGEPRYLSTGEAHRTYEHPCSSRKKILQFVYFAKREAHSVKREEHA